LNNSVTRGVKKVTCGRSMQRGKDLHGEIRASSTRKKKSKIVHIREWHDRTAILPPSQEREGKKPRRSAKEKKKNAGGVTGVDPEVVGKAQIDGGKEFRNSDSGLVWGTGGGTYQKLGTRITKTAG